MKKNVDTQLITGSVIAAFLIAMALTGVIHPPYDPNGLDIVSRFAPPSFEHIFGTDNFGRDIFSRVLSGTGYSLLVALATVFIGAFFGMLTGLTAGYIGGIYDEIVMRLNDALTAFPGILFALVLFTAIGPGKYTIILALGVIFIPSFSRIIRSDTLRLREQEFVGSAKAFGASPYRIMFVHILPNTRVTLLSAVTVGFSNAILTESGMSYLGFGIQPPDPSLGRMLFEAQSYLFKAPWYAIFPGFVIVLAVIAFNLIGEGLRRQFEN